MTTTLPEPCPCAYGLSVDRYRNGKKSCPACDPELGNTPEERIAFYKALIGSPVIAKHLWHLD